MITWLMETYSTLLLMDERGEAGKQTLHTHTSIFLVKLEFKQNISFSS
jgi:hypothetical protein